MFAASGSDACWTNADLCFLSLFGDERFLKLLKDEKFSSYCVIIAAERDELKSPDFECERAVANNTPGKLTCCNPPSSSRRSLY